MRYGSDFEIPAGTTEVDPEIQELGLEYGHIVEVDLLFPAGHAGLTYVQIYHQSRQIFPLTPGEAFRGDDHQVRFSTHFPILEAPLVVQLVGWAPSAEIDHTIIVGITIEAPEPISVGGFTYVSLPEGV